MNRQEFEEFASNNNYTVIQCKGQRIFRPVDEEWDSPNYDLQKNHEVFISRLPNDLLENELLPFLCRAGPVFQIRFIMNFSGSTKGMAYVVFQNVEDAFKAVRTLNNQYIRRDYDQRIRIAFSVNNKRLVIKNIDASKSQEEVKDELSKYLTGIDKIVIKEPPLIQVDETNLAHADFRTHQLAAAARRILVPGGVELWGRVLEADWGKPRDFQTLYVKLNVSLQDESVLRDFFHTHLSKVMKVFLQKNTAFVKFSKFEDAYFVRDHYSHVSMPVHLFGDVYIEKIDWPNK